VRGAPPSPYEGLLGVVVDGDGVALTPGSPLGNRSGRLHGGAIASLHAIAAARAAGAPLVELMLLYVAPPADGPVRAAATVIRRGGLVQVESTLVDAAQATVARALTLHGGRARADAAAAAGRPGSAPPGRADGAAGEPAPPDDIAGAANLETDGPPPLPDLSGAAVVEASAFAATLGIAVVRRERAHGVALLPWRDLLADGDGALHAGALATLVDTASGAAVWTEAGLGDGGRAATVAMHLALQEDTRDQDVVAEAHASAAAAGLVTATLRLWARRSRRLVALGSARYRVVRAVSS